MSPKKTVKNPQTSKKNIAEKIPKRTVTKMKPKLNRPTNIKVSIPLTSKLTASTEMKCRGRTRIKKKLDFETQMELANEVAMAQLVKGQPDENVNNIPKKGRPKRVISDYFKNSITIDNSKTENAVTSISPQKPNKASAKSKPTRTIVTRKRLADSTAQASIDTKRVKVENTTEEANFEIKSEEVPNIPSVVPNGVPVRRRPIVIKPQSIIMQPQATVDNEPEPVVKKLKATAKEVLHAIIEKPVVTERQSIAKLGQSAVEEPQTTKQHQPPIKKPVGRKRKTPKGKQDCVVAGDKLTLQCQTSETKKAVKFKNPARAESRQTSTSSASNLSWTKDISSSSTTTCITVSSNDFVRFNKQLPVIKLTNIDNDIKQRENRAKEAVKINKMDDDDDSSDTSDSDDTDSEPKFPGCLNDCIDAQSLHLSTTSLSSSHLSQILSKGTSSDYSKAIEKLVMILSKIDMEMIKWISSENENVDENIEKLDAMFDVLYHEHGVITHCRQLKATLETSNKDKVEEAVTLEPVKNSDNSNKVENTDNSNKDENTDNSNKVESTDNTNNVEDNTNNTAESNKEVDFLKPAPRLRTLSNVTEGNVSDSSNHESLEEDALIAKNYPYYDHHDDDDALSLFAESITCFESSKANNSIPSVSNARQFEEYVPKPLKEDFLPNTQKHTYCPTTIREDTDVNASSITICEKQNADSTSIFKQSVSTDDTGSYQDFNENTDLDTRMDSSDVIEKPRLMEYLLEVSPRTRSSIFNGLCFYNLESYCRKSLYRQCPFLHVVPTSEQIKAKLILLDDRTFLQEYMLLRNWVGLRRMYGMYFVEECAKRRLTRILVEMAFDFIVKVKNTSEKDVKLRVDTIETTLLYLNDVDLSECEDLLKLTIRFDGVSRTLLCDVFMATMSITQNFSRFKCVFLNLTYFMVANDRTFNKDVVEHILERVCILPFEESVARALIQMMRLTKPEIFKNSMIGLFEKQISVNKDVFDEYSLLKNQYEFTSMLASTVMGSSPPLKVNEPLLIRPETGDDQPPALSPDTTNLDNMNKTAEEPPKPLITRTIGMNHPIIFNRTQYSPMSNQTHENASPSGTSTRGHDSGPPVRPQSSESSSNDMPNYKKWRNRTIFAHLPPPRVYSERPMMRAPSDRTLMRAPVHTPTRPQIRTHMRPPRLPFNQRLVTFKSPVNCGNRQPGPKY